MLKMVVFDEIMTFSSIFILSSDATLKPSDVTKSLLTFTRPSNIIFSASLLEQTPDIDSFFEILINFLKSSLLK